MHIEPAYKFDTSANIHTHARTRTPNFSAIGQSAAELLMTETVFPARFPVTASSAVWQVPEFCYDVSQALYKFVFKCPTCCSVLKHECVKDQISHFYPPRPL